MIVELSPEQRSAWDRFRAFADKEVAPYAAEFDQEEAISDRVVRSLAEAGHLAAPVAARHGGGGLDWVAYGLLTEELGRACQNIRNFVAVEDMVAHSIERWGEPTQRERWIGPIRRGEKVAAFALTEPGVGSDAGAIEALAEKTTVAGATGFTLRGVKKWISYAQLADLFLVFAKLDGQHTAFLVERDNPGLTVTPIRGLLGLRGSMLGEVVLDDCRVPADAMIGRPGMGLTFVASAALDLGRYSTAWGSVGLAYACLDASVRYADEREQYGVPISDHQLVRRMLADMVTDITATRLLCHEAGVAKEHGSSDAVNLTLMAKYRASVLANRSADDAVQIHGAAGVGAQAQVQRHYRDAKVMEIIEGTTQIQQSLLGRYAGQVIRRR
ncbi:acyl-CoA dehydrogenase family protein [Micromonospora sp. FIMYZ51]|uniref:acyl-CoA dehydrogenase family protein n=1 Tax=Micromonospora sp. FIMYZ51 TaxID=3051832 RepID=UPI00311EB198